MHISTRCPGSDCSGTALFRNTDPHSTEGSCPVCGRTWKLSGGRLNSIGPPPTEPPAEEPPSCEQLDQRATGGRDMVGLRERKKLQTYETLHHVALDMFERQGFHATTVDQIADVADVSTRTFFRYFPTKIDVLLADQPQRVAALRELLGQRPPEEPVLEAMADALTLLCQDANDRRDTLLLQARIARADPLVLRGLLAHHVEVSRTLQAFVKARVSDDRFSLRAHTASDVPFGVFCDALDHWLLHGAAGTLELPIQDMVDCLREPVDLR
jgi:AcrR family transcriptional regulator